MQLDRLQMRNFKRYRTADVKFGDGITGIVGNNGTGKSTIVEAILFCLYGVKETGLEYLLSSTAGKEDRAEVRLDFSVRGEEYQVVRSLGPRKRHEVQVHQGGRLMARGVSEVREALGRIVRMGPADFRHTVFAGQKELLSLVDAPPEERKRWFRKVLGIDSLKEEGGEILKGEVAAARDGLLRVEGRLRDTDADGIRRDMEETGQGILDRDREIRELLGGEAALASARAGLEEEMKGHRDRERRCHGIVSLIQAKEKETTGLEKDLDETRERLAALEGCRREYRDLAGKENGFLALQDRFMESTRRARTFQDLTTRASDLAGWITETESELALLQDDEARLERDAERVRDLAPALARRGEIQERLAEMRGREERYRTLAAAMERKGATLGELAKQGGILRTRIEEMREARLRLCEVARDAGIPAELAGDPVPALESRRLEIQQVMADRKAERDQVARRIGELDSTLSTLDAEGADGSCPTCRQPLGDHYQELVAEIGKDVTAFRSRFAALESEIRQAEKNLAAVHAVLRDARRLLDACSRLDEASTEWTAIQEQTLREISLREGLEQEMASLGYDPAARQAMEEELGRLEAPWRESLAASERLKALPEIVRRMKNATERAEKYREEVRGLSVERDGLGFDPLLHAGIEEEYHGAQKDHGRYLELKPVMDRVPVLLGQETDLLARLASAALALEGLRSELAATGFSPEDLRLAESRLEENSRQALEMGRGLERARAGKSQLERERLRLTEALGRLEEDTRDRDRLREEIRLLELTREELNGFTDHLLGIVRAQIQDETGRILSEITDGRYDTVLLDDDFKILVHDLGGDYPVSRFSGGEQDDVAIALRIALSRYIAEMHELHDSTFLVFDEIFGSQDEERRGNIFRALRALEPYFPQIFLISHVTEVQGEFGSTLLVEAVSGSESRIRDLEGGAA